MKQPNFSDAVINDEIHALSASMGDAETTVENLIVRLTERGKTQDPPVGPGWKPRFCRLLREWRNAQAQPAEEPAGGPDGGAGVASDAIPGLAIELSRANASVTTLVTAHIAGLCQRSDRAHRVVLDKITAEAADELRKLRGLWQGASSDAKSLEEDVQQLTDAAESDAKHTAAIKTEVSKRTTAFAELQKDLNARTVRYEAGAREFYSARDTALQKEKAGAVALAKLRADHGAMVDQHTACMPRVVELQEKVDALAGVSAILAATSARVVELEQQNAESLQTVNSQLAIIEDLRVRLAATTSNAEMMQRTEMLLSSVTLPVGQ